MTHIYNITFALPNELMVQVVSHFRKEVIPVLENEFEGSFELFRLVEPIHDEAVSSICLQVRLEGKEQRDAMLENIIFKQCMQDIHKKFGDSVLSFDSFLAPIHSRRDKE